MGIDETEEVRRGQFRKRIAYPFKKAEIYPGFDGNP